MSSLLQIYVFYRPELTGKLWPHGIKILSFWNAKIISTDRAQRVDDKNGVIRLVIFIPRVMVIKMSKMARFMYLQLNIAKISLGKIFKCIWKVLFNPFRKYYGLCSSELPLAKSQHLKILDFDISLLTHQFFW